MKSLIQRVSQARVDVDGEVVGAIGKGLLALVAVEQGDGDAQVKRMAERLAGYRVFPDAQGRMNLSVASAGGSILLVSQFTLAADTRKGMRPSFSGAAPPDRAEPLIAQLAETLRALDITVATGQFQTDMQVSLINDGPVTFLLEV